MHDATSHLLLRRRVPSEALTLPVRYLLAAPGASVADLLRLWVLGAASGAAHAELRVADRPQPDDRVGLDRFTRRIVYGHLAGEAVAADPEMVSSETVSITDALHMGEMGVVVVAEGFAVAVLTPVARIGEEVARVDRFMAASRGLRADGRVWESSGLAVEHLAAAAVPAAGTGRGA